jgi:hypothetical protein
MNKRLVERIGMAAVIAALLAYFCYQVAYGMSETITNGNVTATLTAPPGSKVNNFTIVPEGNTSYGNTSYAYPLVYRERPHQLNMVLAFQFDQDVIFNLFYQVKIKSTLKK